MTFTGSYSISHFTKITPKIHLLIAVCALCLAANTSNAVELFNGKDFTGWTFFERGNTDPKNTWSI